MYTHMCKNTHKHSQRLTLSLTLISETNLKSNSNLNRLKHITFPAGAPVGAVS